MSGFFEEIREQLINRRYEAIDNEVSRAQESDIIKIICIMLELNVSKEIIKEKLIKYWDLRPSEVDYFVKEAKEVENATNRHLQANKSL